MQLQTVIQTAVDANANSLEFPVRSGRAAGSCAGLGSFRRLGLPETERKHAAQDAPCRVDNRTNLFRRCERLLRR